MSLAPTKAISWNLAEIWNAVAYKPNKDLKPRDYIYASEIGMPFVDRWLKMKAVPFTNPPNSRSQRKFLAGNLMEFIVKQILIAAGIYKHDEIKVDATPYDGCLSVHGRLDFKAGGYVDQEEALDRLNPLNLPDYLHDIARKIIESMAGKTLEELILELKSISSFAFDKVEKIKRALPHNALQGYHYQRNGPIPANICYICKDDCRMLQFGINETETEPIYRADIEEMTDLFKKKKRPDPAPLATFDFLQGKFSKNLQVEYSPYLTMVYGFADPDEYRASVKYVDSWNRVLVRFVKAELGHTTDTGKPINITPKNKDVQSAIVKAGYDFNALVSHKISLGGAEEEGEVE
jgi:hypothetical protein